MFASPERTLLFDLNDFDETLPGPFEYDVARMAASFTIAARNNGFTKAEAREVTRTSVSAYRSAMAEFAAMDTMEIWYARLSEDELLAAIKTARGRPEGQGAEEDGQGQRRGAPGRSPPRRTPATACRRSPSSPRSSTASTASSASRRSSSRCASLTSASTACPPMSSSTTSTREFRAYRATLQSDRRHLLEKFEIVDVARKVVGVGSVGTRAFIVLLQGRDEQDPLFLQVKEATTSVLEDHLPRSRHQPGSRVVHGQRMMQAASDIYLGWTKGVQANRYLYWRQLRDMKGSVVVEAMVPMGLAFYARQCGWTLARAHARSGDPVAIAAYLGKSDALRAVDDRLLRALRGPERARLRGLRQSGQAPDGGRRSRACDALGQTGGDTTDIGQHDYHDPSILDERGSHERRHREDA